jgi:hypothetical protein
LDPIRPTDLEPTPDELDALLESEDRHVAEKLDVPDDVKEELLENIRRRHESDEETARADEPLTD